MARARHRQDLAIFLVAFALLYACSRSSQPGVGLKAVTADLSFGIPPLTEEAFQSSLAQLGEVDLRIELPRSPREVTTVPPAAPKCPEAPITEFVDEEAPIDAKGRPAEDLYDWKLDGHHAVQGGGQSVKVALSPFEERRIEGVTQDPANRDNYTFRHVEVIKGTSPPITRTASYELNNSDPEASFNHPTLGRVESPRLRGLRLIKFEQKGAQGTTVFQPNRPILYLPVPVRVGTSFTSAETDPRNGIALAHSGVIRGRILLDACGELISAWLIDGEQTVTQGGSAVRRNYDYAVATQFGATIVFEHVEDPCQQTVNGQCQPEPRLVYDSRVGSLGPKA